MQTILVTGATSGIGFAVCDALLAEGNRVIGIGRSKERCAEAQENLSAKYPNGYNIFFCADLMQQAEVKRVAAQLTHYLDDNCDGKLQVLINNAGCVRSWYATTTEGYEQQFSLNHLSGFLLTHYLLPYLQRSQGKVIMTSSASHKGMRVRWADIMFSKRYRPLLVYKQSKLCNLLFAQAINANGQAAGIRAYCVDPGLVRTNIGNKETGGIVDFVWSLRKNGGVPPEIPARTYAWLCRPDNRPCELYFYNSKAKRHSRHVTQVNAARLFQLSEQLCNITFGQVQE